MIALRPRDRHVWDPRPVPHETEAETKTNYSETETETKIKKWSGDHVGLETLTSLVITEEIASNRILNDSASILRKFR